MAEEKPSQFHQHSWLLLILSHHDGKYQRVHDHPFTPVDHHPDEEQPVQSEVPGWAGQSVEEQQAEVPCHLHDGPQSCLAL